MTENKNPGNDSSAEFERQRKRKVLLFAALLGCIFLVVLWLIFRPAPVKPQEGAAGINTTVPDGKAQATVGDKRKAAEQVRDATLTLYSFARDFAAQRGIILADTKFEFGTDADGTLYVMDEVLTPDSSRYWPADQYHVGSSPPSYDKQFVRDYLETLDWNKTAPGPTLPADVIAKTRAKYAEALQKLAGISVD